MLRSEPETLEENNGRRRGTEAAIMTNVFSTTTQTMKFTGLTVGFALEFCYGSEQRD